jgi:methionyl-tRNA formyltransferase
MKLTTLRRLSICQISSPRRTAVRWSSSAAAPEPLRILFCGSDDFSCASLTALAEEMKSDPRLISDIHVVTRPDKREGRGMRMRERTLPIIVSSDMSCTDTSTVPIKTIARSLSLPTHTIDTFTGWSPPPSFPPNLIVAVSFGLFVPSRILRAASYGGLNVHPSLLPDLPGASPIPHAILLARRHTGVTLQTLSTEGFDRGAAVARTDPIPVAPDATLPALTRTLADAGAELLVGALRDGAAHRQHRQPDGDRRQGERRLLARRLAKPDAQWPFATDLARAAGQTDAEALEARGRALPWAAWTVVGADGAGARVQLGGLRAVEQPPAQETLVLACRTGEGGERVDVPVTVSEDDGSVTLHLGSEEEVAQGRRSALRVMKAKVGGGEWVSARKCLKKFIETA